MKRKFLEDLGIEKDTIDKIMEEHGKGVTAAKKDYEDVTIERDRLSGELETANKTIEGFADYEDTKKAAEEYKEKLEETEKRYKQENAERQFNSVLEDAIAAAGGIDAVSIKAHLDIASMMDSKDQSKDIAAAIESIKSKKGYLFGKQEPITVAVTKTDGTKITDITPDAFKKMGYKERLELKNSDPTKYDELKGE